MFYDLGTGVSKVFEILEVVDDQELVANSCKIIRICLRDDIVYDKLAIQFPKLTTMILEKMAKWNQSTPVIQESINALRNYARKPDYLRHI